MLDRLPVELVEHIDTLLALCGTSRMLSAVAQPALFEVVELFFNDNDNRDPGEVDWRFLSAVETKRLGDAVKTLRLWGLYFELDPEVEEESKKDIYRPELLSEDVLALASMCPKVVEVRIECLEGELNDLTNFPRLRRLILDNFKSFTVPPMAFPHLHELQMTYVGSSCNLSRADILARMELPVLEILRILGYEADAMFAWLDQHLHCLSLQWYCTEYQLYSFVPLHQVAHTRVLPAIDLLRDDKIYPPTLVGMQMTKNLQLFALPQYPANDPGWPTNAFYASRAAAALQTLTTAIPTFSDLSSLFLPSVLDSTASSPMLDTLKNAMTSLLAACEAQKIEVMWEQPFTSAEQPFTSALVPPEFRRRCKALKAKQEEGGKKGKEQS
ncbi:hypothetical protein JCM10213_006663 [Rhodosporidiobolus nylandii]